MMAPGRGRGKAMGVLSGLQPERVFHYFEEICGIPHGSGHVEAISDYLVEFAKRRGLAWIRDGAGNVIFIKEASPGYEGEAAVILQGHMDMVAVSEPGLAVDMTREPLRLAVEGDRIRALGTSLGGDDGIAVAYMLALFEDGSLKHPRLEAVITVDEEVGMDGARVIDLSMLQGRRMINLDSEEEGIFLAGCAGGARIRCHLGTPASEHGGRIWQVTLGGLKGGHSGGEIHRERGNSNLLMGRFLRGLSRELETGLLSCQGGMADNAIPRESVARILVPEGAEEKLRAFAAAWEKEAGAELASRDPGFFLRLERGEAERALCLWGEELDRCAAYWSSLPNGAQAMSQDIEGLVETSLNLGVLHFSAREGLEADFSVRSSIESAKRALLDKVEALTELAGGTCRVEGDYPGWAYRVHSPLREKMTALYEEMYGRKPRIEAIHAGLECGLLAAKITDLDCVSMGPDMRDIHTAQETLSISSTARVWEYLVRLLEQKDGEILQGRTGRRL